MFSSFSLSYGRRRDLIRGSSPPFRLGARNEDGGWKGELPRVNNKRKIRGKGREGSL